MALALNNLKSVDMPLNKETKPNQKKTIDNFDVTMDSFDCADFAGIYILETLGRFLEINNIGLYRDGD